MDVFAGDGAAIFGQGLVGIGEDRGHGAAGVAPLVNDLFEDAGVGVLGDEGGAQHFYAFPGDLFDDGRVIEEPPAAEGHELCELAGVDAEFVLVFAAEQTDEEPVIREFEAESFDGAEIGFAYAIAREFEGRVNEIADADHDRQGDVEFAAGGEDGFAQEEGAGGVFGELEGIGQRAGHVDGFGADGPIGDESADFAGGGTVGFEVDGVAFFAKDFAVLGPLVEDAVEAEDGVELGVGGGALLPERVFGGIEGVVGHDDFADAGKLEDILDVGFELLVGKEFAGGLEGPGVAGSGEAEGMEDGDDAAGGF